MTGRDKGIAILGDIGASMAAMLMAASHWAQVLTPIVTLLVGLTTLAWWWLRFRDRLKNGKESTDDAG